MKNTMDFNNKTMQAATVAVMNDILSSEATGSSMDDLYTTVCKYVKMTREQFEDAYKQADEKLNSWKNNGSLNGSNCELSEDDLDMVVGGSIGSFIETIGIGIAIGAKAVGNFVKEHAAEIGMIAALGLMIACPGAIIGVTAGTMALAVGAVGTTGVIALTGIGAAIGFGVGVGIGVAYN